MGSCQIALLLSTFVLYSLCSDVRYVLPSGANSDACPSLNASCNELGFYTNTTDEYFTDNSVFIFLKGTHELHSILLIDSVNNLTMMGLGNSEIGFHEKVLQTTVVLQCVNDNNGVLFINVTKLTLTGITITDCNVSPSSVISQSDSLRGFYDYTANIGSFVDDSRNFFASLFMIEIRELLFQNMSIQNATNFGLIPVNVFDSHITTSSFAINNIRVFDNFEGCSTIRNISCSGGNILAMYTYSYTMGCDVLSRTFTFDVTQSNFTHGYGNIRYDYFNSFGGGVSVLMDQGDSYKVDVTMDRIIAFNNTAQLSGNINFLTGMGVKYFTFSLINSISSYGNQRLKSSASSGGGLQISLGVTSELYPHSCIHEDTLSISNTSVSIFNTNFTNNIARYGGAVNVFVNQTFSRIHFSTCLIARNYGWRGIGMYINQNNFNTLLEYIFENVTIRQSVYLGSIQSSEDYRSSISLFRMRNFKFINLVVEDNSPNFGAYFYYSKVSFGGKGNRFSNCSSFGSGGGLHLSALSSLVLEPSAVIVFDSNHADEQGGAIYANTDQLLSPLCFLDISHPPPHLVFINNTANTEGDAVYIGECSRLRDDERTNKVAALLDTFDFSQQVGVEPISSSPYNVSFCGDNSSIEDISFRSINSHPGERVNLRIATVGIEGIPSSGLMKIDFMASNSSKIYSVFKYSKSECFDFSFNVLPRIDSFSIEISINKQQFTSTGFNLRKSVTTFVDVLVCPTGFELFNDNCVCNRLLERIVGNITTNVSTQMFTRQGNIWFGHDNHTNSLLVDTNCPFDYCHKSSVSFVIHNSDDQCDLERSGKVCGQCKNGLSLLLGSNKCSKCSSLWLLLIIPFSLAAGVALVAMLIVLNLTVTLGTINGLVFYANVIKLREFSFFPDGSVPVVSQFVSWVNLDFGITCCFYDGFDAIGKLWMQFLFPAYIFAIIIVIIVICKYSNKAAKLFGHNAVPVFATLILLSYTKLFRLVVPIIQFKQVTTISNTSAEAHETVWSVDPNIQYTSFSHMALVIVALLVLLLLVIPYTLVLLIQPVMLKLQIGCFQKLCLNFKPLFDAYYGPFKTKSQIFPGLLLVARLILVIVASISDSDVYLSSTVTTVVVLLTIMIAFQGVYKELYLNILESVFLLNLAIAAIFVERAYYTSIISVCITIIMFGGIIGLHICKKPTVQAT